MACCQQAMLIVDGQTGAESNTCSKIERLVEQSLAKIANNFEPRRMARFLLYLSVVMAWQPRILGTDLCYHVRVQCNNREFRFADTADFERYLAIVALAKQKLQFLLHHYTLMHTHVHLIITTPGPALLDRVMYYINQRYAVDYHRRTNRHGHFWMNGYRSSVIDTDRYALTCMRYLDRNPLRAGLVQCVDAWPWSCYPFYGDGQANPLLDEHPSYLTLATQPEDRCAAYRDFVATLLPTDEAREQTAIHQSMRRYKNA